MGRRLPCWLLLSCSLGSVAGAQRPTERSLAARLAERVRAVPGAEVAVSYRDLATGDSIDLGADVDFHAASTMKIPVMLEVVRAAEQQRLGLAQEILLINRFHSIVDGSPYSLNAADDGDSSMYARVGHRVAVRELLERMIVRSSNLATNALIALVGADRATAAARALGASRIRVLRGVEDQKAFDAGLINTTTSADLAVLLRRIERGEGLRPSSASLMKDVLLRQEFNDEIPAGVPAGTAVAHKTGSITATLHDAAIVYPPGRAPYVLVVLTRGIPSEAVARALIVDVSRLVWQHSSESAGAVAR
ncbi:MAG: class A beta-lactamase-related serine hydrolase [Gemmatimonadaceae bacterium]|nr:class A beta-lactamase-related serine hydrolase [Gemmatimonadaceae bacterium]